MRVNGSDFSVCEFASTLSLAFSRQQMELFVVPHGDDLSILPLTSSLRSHLQIGHVVPALRVLHAERFLAVRGAAHHDGRGVQQGVDRSVGTEQHLQRRLRQSASEADAPLDEVPQTESAVHTDRQSHLVGGMDAEVAHGRSRRERETRRTCENPSYASETSP